MIRGGKRKDENVLFQESRPVIELRIELINVINSPTNNTEIIKWKEGGGGGGRKHK